LKPHVSGEIALLTRICPADIINHCGPLRFQIC